LQERVPAYLIPAQIILVDELPLTSNGKIDREQLRQIGEQEQEPREVQAPRTPLEELLAEIFADVLARDGIGRQESFFRLGGHSLLAMQVISRIRALCQVELPILALFETPSWRNWRSEWNRTSRRPGVCRRHWFP